MLNKIKEKKEISLTLYWNISILFALRDYKHPLSCFAPALLTCKASWLRSYF